MSLVPFRKTSQTSLPAFTTGFDEFDRMFDNFFRNALTNIAAPATSVADLSVRLDVSETDKAYVIKADLPGLEDKDVEVTLNDGILTVAGEKRHEAEEKGRTWHRVERSYGQFRRSLALPADADENGISANMRNGVLTIEIGKSKQAAKTVRRIEIGS